MTAHAEPVSAPLLHDDNMTSAEYSEAVAGVAGLRAVDEADDEDVENQFENLNGYRCSAAVLVTSRKGLLYFINAQLPVGPSYGSITSCTVAFPTHLASPS